MDRFANALEKPSDPTSLRLAWLAGLLDGEGTFLRPPPSSPNCPIVACRMTDRDVVDRVAVCFGTKVLAIDKGRYRTEYAATIKGSRAIEFMADVRPLMSDRRRQAIDTGKRAYVPPLRKLSFELAEEIRRRFAEGDSISSLAHIYEVKPQTIRPILRGEIYASAPLTPWRDLPSDQGDAISLSGFLKAELCWLAGWLEGEGSFLAPPPSDPRRPRISAQSKDKDVVAEASRLCGVTPSRHNPERARLRGWSPTWRLLLRGTRAVLLMQSLNPLLGIRRQRQVESALSARPDLASMEAVGFEPTCPVVARRRLQV
jgi:hypothetical protein